MSFADEDGFKGAIVAEADSLSEAIDLVFAAGINPGGEVAAFDVTGAPEAARYPRMKLLSREDMELLDRERGKFFGEMTEKERASFRANVMTICDECN